MIVLLFLILFCCQQLSAQDGLLQQVTDHYAAGYLTAVDHNAAIFSGNREQPLGFLTSNHQYFKEQGFTTGRLSFGGIIYPNVQLRWDLFRDDLIILSPKKYTIVLNAENVDFFEIHGSHIFYKHPDVLAGCPPAGYYKLLYSTNKYVLFEKISKYLQEENVKKYRYNFKMSSKFYLQRDDSYYRIQNKRTLLNSLGTHRKELKQFMRANELQYKKYPEITVYETIKEHERLTRR